MKWDPESPRFKQAMYNLRFEPDDIQFVSYFQVALKHEDQQLRSLHYHYNIRKIRRILNEIITERNNIIKYKSQSSKYPNKFLSKPVGIKSKHPRCKSESQLDHQLPQSQNNDAEMLRHIKYIYKISIDKKKTESMAKVIDERHNRVQKTREFMKKAFIQQTTNNKLKERLSMKLKGIVNQRINSKSRNYDLKYLKSAPVIPKLKFKTNDEAAFIT